MELKNILNTDTKDTVFRFNEALIALSTNPFSGRVFRRVQDLEEEARSPPSLLSFGDIAKAAFYEAGARQSFPIEYFSDEIVSKVCAKPRVSIAYYPQFCQGTYEERLPEINVAITSFDDEPIEQKVTKRLSELGLRPKCQAYALSREKIVYAPLLM
jgi:hypothetical protein